MKDPARFYVGQVSHRRFGSAGHVLRYPIAYLWLDLDRVAEAGKLTRFLNVGAGGTMSFNPRDHGDGRSDDLAAWVRAFLRKQGVGGDAETIELLTLPRMFGYVFNPVSVYFIRDRQNRLHHVLYEVGNTFGERHFYLCTAQADQDVHEHVCDKAFYVSPFFDTDGFYEFQVRPPGETVSLSISYRTKKEERLRAVLAGRLRPVTDRTALGLLLGFPFMTLGVIAAIHWEALKIWLKGARAYRHGPRKKEAGISYSRDRIVPQAGKGAA